MRYFHFDRLLAAYITAENDLLAERVGEGHWVGHLASSALATATAVSALALVQGSSLSGRPQPECRVSGPANDLQPLIEHGLEFLSTQQNDDGGFGDTDLSHSNIATTMLVQAAFHLAGAADQHHRGMLARAADYIELKGGIRGLRARYGKDKTFAVPILTNQALAGLADWRDVGALPFELAAFPQSWYRFFRLPVVSYAIPALVAIGQARYFHRKPRNPIIRGLRAVSVKRTLKVLERMQPKSGGYLEAIPLTSFVVMSLAGTGRAGHPVVQRGVRFLLDTAREDGSWPIDTNLATWVTTLSLNAMAMARGSDAEVLRSFDTAKDIEWLLACQNVERHPFTGAAPGGWGWSDLSGAVPDVDDTAGALLALAKFADPAKFDRHAPHGHGLFGRAYRAALRGSHWLANIQNRDGGWPTFCRGWGTLPFDRSSPDLTAHAIRALAAWMEFGKFGKKGSNRFWTRIRRGFEYLAESQRADGSWIPLWFGNQEHPHEENPVYGTARVLLAYRDFSQTCDAAAVRGTRWLIANQNADGGWGSAAAGTGSVLNIANANGSSVEETAWAVEGLLAGLDNPSLAVDNSLQHAIVQGVDWLIQATEDGRHRQPAPVGFYFAKLWYYERLYPQIFTVGALGEAVRRWLEQR